MQKKWHHQGNFLAQIFLRLFHVCRNLKKLLILCFRILNVSVEQGQKLLEATDHDEFFGGHLSQLCREFEVAELEETIKNQCTRIYE